jgi:hypothetical protein
VPLIVVSTRLDGHAADAAILGSSVQLALAAGMLLRLRWVRGLLIAYLAGCLFVGTMVVAVFGLLYAYVGLAHIETLMAGLAGLYYAFMIWAFFYMFHPSLTDVFEWNWTQNLAEARSGQGSVPQAA